MPKAPVKLTVSVSFDGEQADIEVDSSQKVGDIIKQALLSFEVDEDPDDCHLDAGDRKLFPPNDVAGLDLGSGVMLTLMLPF